jgi:hypothetical protein
LRVRGCTCFVSAAAAAAAALINCRDGGGDDDADSNLDDGENNPFLLLSL